MREAAGDGVVLDGAGPGDDEQPARVAMTSSEASISRVLTVILLRA